MVETIDGPRRGAVMGEADSLVVLLHGYGADGDDLFGLSDALSQVLPTTAFAAPNAPDPCTNNPMGYQWFPIPWLDGSSEEEAVAGFKRAAEILDGFLDAEMARTGVTPERTALIGFSQGTMLSLHVAPRREKTLAGVVGFSGRLLAPQGLAQEARTKPPVLLVHGDQDQVVPPSSLEEARGYLSKAGFSVRTHVSRGSGHGIAPDGFQLAAQFLVAALAPQKPG